MQTALLPRCCASRRRSLDRTHSRRSGLSVRTGLYAPIQSLGSVDGDDGPTPKRTLPPRRRPIPAGLRSVNGRHLQEFLSCFRFPWSRAGDQGLVCRSLLAEIESGTESLLTLCWRRQSRANPSLKGRNSLLAGKIQGISSIRRLGSASTATKNDIKPEPYGPIPCASEQGIICGLTGNLNRRSGNFPP